MRTVGTDDGKPARRSRHADGMPRSPQPLPSDVPVPAFSTRHAQRAGITRGRTRSSDLHIPFYGTRLPAGVDDLVSRCLARATRLPLSAVFSHLTAALLWGLPLPRALADGAVLHVTVPTGRRAPQGKTTRGHQAHLDAVDVARVGAVA